jgi:hypothetical protein
VEVQQGGGARVHFQDHIAAAAAVPAIGAGQRLELLSPDRGAAVPAVARLHPQRYLVGELRHCFLPFRMAGHVAVRPAPASGQDTSGADRLAVRP